MYFFINYVTHYEINLFDVLKNAKQNELINKKKKTYTHDKKKLSRR